MKYYSLEPILKRKCQYNLIFGERSNGKTYSVLEYILNDFVGSGGKNQGAIIRRWREDFANTGGDTLFDPFIENGYIKKITKGEWTDVCYYSRRWWFCRYIDKTLKREMDSTPIAYSFAITEGEHKKSTSYPGIKTILFDEFLTRLYLPDEFILFQNLLSTIIRNKDDVIIFMLGNTVNKYCPYFQEMGLYKVKDQEQGTIDVYDYSNSGLHVAVEYCSNLNKKGKSSDKYFAFNNPKLSMITKGTWEFNNYPHLPIKYLPKNIAYIYYIVFDEQILQANIIVVDNNIFTYIHRKTTPIKNNLNRLVFDLNASPEPNHKLYLNKPTDAVTKKLYKFFVDGQVYYQDNEVGEIVNNYLTVSKKAV